MGLNLKILNKILFFFFEWCSLYLCFKSKSSFSSLLIYKSNVWISALQFICASLCYNSHKYLRFYQILRSLSHFEHRNSRLYIFSIFLFQFVLTTHMVFSHFFSTCIELTLQALCKKIKWKCVIFLFMIYYNIFILIKFFKQNDSNISWSLQSYLLFMIFPCYLYYFILYLHRFFCY